MVAVELEVMAKKMDRFGWERDRGSMAHDRLVSDWMDALHDYPLDEVKAGCAAWVLSNPRKMPNEGDIRGEIQKARKRTVQALPRHSEPEPVKERVSDEARARIMKQAGFTPKRFGGAS